jgi:hypothetical protein
VEAFKRGLMKGFWTAWQWFWTMLSVAMLIAMTATIFRTVGEKPDNLDPLAWSDAFEVLVLFVTLWLTGVLAGAEIHRNVIDPLKERLK